MGETHWTKSCTWCHGPAAMAGGGAPVLRALVAALALGAMKKIMIDGERELRGMPKFSEFSDDDIVSVQHYLRKKAREALREKKKIVQLQ